MKKEPFDLEKALAGHPLVTRDGCDVTDFCGIRDGSAFPYLAKISGLKHSFAEDGSWAMGWKSNHDLLLKIENPDEPDYTCLKYQAGVILAADGGADIEASAIKNPAGTGWLPMTGRCFNFQSLRYRVKPQPKAPRFCDVTFWIDPNRPEWGHAYRKRISGTHSGEELFSTVELTPEVIAALEAAGIPTKGGES